MATENCAFSERNKSGIEWWQYEDQQNELSFSSCDLFISSYRLNRSSRLAVVSTTGSSKGVFGASTVLGYSVVANGSDGIFGRYLAWRKTQREGKSSPGRSRARSANTSSTPKPNPPSGRLILLNSIGYHLGGTFCSWRTTFSHIERNPNRRHLPRDLIFAKNDTAPTAYQLHSNNVKEGVGSPRYQNGLGGDGSRGSLRSVRGGAWNRLDGIY